MSYIDEHGIKRDDRPNASALFLAMINRGLDDVMRLVEASGQAGRPVQLVYSEHRSTRGIKLISIGPGAQ